MQILLVAKETSHILEEFSVRSCIIYQHQNDDADDDDDDDDDDDFD